MPPFLQRVLRLPRLGLGLSTEHGAVDVPGALDPLELRALHPSWGAFLEVGVETARGLDRLATTWADRGHPTTYHFLDVNLDDPDDLDAAWLAEVRRIATSLRPAWLCGDAGLWHFGARDRGHMLLLPPILLDEAVGPMADGITALREATGHEVLPENPPGTVWIGHLHLLDFFARVCEQADTGMLLDCAHLALYQRQLGHGPLAALDGFPLDRVTEIHIAGGTVRDHHGLPWVDDDHGVDVLDDTWQIAEHVLEHAPNLKAIVLECERNSLSAVTPLFERVGALAGAWGRP